MTTKFAFLGVLGALAMFLNTACSTSKTTSMNSQSSSTDAKVVKSDQNLAPVAEPPPAGHQTWGSNISPYAN